MSLSPSEFQSALLLNLFMFALTILNYVCRSFQPPEDGTSLHKSASDENVACSDSAEEVPVSVDQETKIPTTAERRSPLHSQCERTARDDDETHSRTGHDTSSITAISGGPDSTGSDSDSVSGSLSESSLNWSPQGMGLETREPYTTSVGHGERMGERHTAEVSVVGMAPSEEQETEAQAHTTEAERQRIEEWRQRTEAERWMAREVEETTELEIPQLKPETPAADDETMPASAWEMELDCQSTTASDTTRQTVTATTETETLKTGTETATISSTCPETEPVLLGLTTAGSDEVPITGGGPGAETWSAAPAWVRTWPADRGPTWARLRTPLVEMSPAGAEGSEESQLVAEQTETSEGVDLLQMVRHSHGDADADAPYRQSAAESHSDSDPAPDSDSESDSSFVASFEAVSDSDVNHDPDSDSDSDAEMADAQEDLSATTLHPDSPPPTPPPSPSLAALVLTGHPDCSDDNDDEGSSGGGGGGGGWGGGWGGGGGERSMRRCSSDDVFLELPDQTPVRVTGRPVWRRRLRLLLPSVGRQSRHPGPRASLLPLQEPAGRRPGTAGRGSGAAGGVGGLPGIGRSSDGDRSVAGPLRNREPRNRDRLRDTV